MATKFGVRNYSRSGDVVNFTIVALNADGSVDKTYTGGVSLEYFNSNGTTSYTYSELDEGARAFTLTITDPAARASIIANFPSADTSDVSAAAVLVVSGPSGDNVFASARGENLFVGGAGRDVYHGSTGNDLFRLERGGNDTAFGNGGDDTFYFGAAYSEDGATGGTGRDRVLLQGNYSGGVSLFGLSGIEEIVLLSGQDTRFGDLDNRFYSYNIVASDATVTGGQTLLVDGSALGNFFESLTFDGSAETDSNFTILGGRFIDTLIGGSGDDTFFFGSSREFFAGDTINGGAGIDSLILHGNYTIDFTESRYAGALADVEKIIISSATDERYASGFTEFDYSITWDGDLLASGATMIVDGSLLGSEESLAFNGSDETDGRFELNGGAGNDVLTGGAGDDVIFGGGRGDTLTGGAGNDIFVYRTLDDSNSTERDGIQDFNLGDRIDITAIDANVLVAGNQAFTFIGNAAFTGAAGELRFENISLGGPIWLVQGDTDGNGFSDFEIVLVISPADPITYSDFIDLVDDTAAVAADDTNSTVETASVSGNVTDNDVDAEGDAFLVTAVNGDGTKLGQQITLPSGALLTLNADGTYTYDPNGKFNSLISAAQAEATGAVNVSATDTFTYTVTGGDTATVTVTINGQAGPGDVLGGSSADNAITGTSTADQFVVDQGGDDMLMGEGGNDAFYFGAAFTANDRVNGGEGTDVIQLRGDYSAGLTLAADTVTGVERITLFSGTSQGGASRFDYTITTNDATVASGQLMTVLASGLLEDETLVFNGSAETDGAFSVFGGASADTLVGGQKNDGLFGGGGDDLLYGLAGNDYIVGGGGADQLRGGFGSDMFVYTATSDSTAAAMDRIVDFEATLDLINLAAIDADSGQDGDQAFSFIGFATFSGTRGELRAYEDNGSWFVEGDVDGDSMADLVIQVGVFNGHIMVESDFVL